jgi:hypothetical protein
MNTQVRHVTIRRLLRRLPGKIQPTKFGLSTVTKQPQPERKFARYFTHPNVTVTIVAGDSFSPMAPRTSREVLIVRDAWYPLDPEQAVAGFLKANGRVSDRIYFLSNTEEMHAIRLGHGLNSHYVNIGCFVDESVFRPEPQVVREFDAVMNARFWKNGDGTELKRHHLTGKIERLALLDPVFWSTDTSQREKYAQRDNCRFINHKRLSPAQVADVLRRTHVGLALSAREGVCRASSEYLLTGLPVVSTDSVGGRDVWYDDYNAIIVSPTEEDVLTAVRELKNVPRDARRIRNDYLTRAAVFRNRFRDDVLASICATFQVDRDLDYIMRTWPFRWWPTPSITSLAWWTSGLSMKAPRIFLKQRVIAPLQRRWFVSQHRR